MSSKQFYKSAKKVRPSSVNCLVYHICNLIHYSKTRAASLPNDSNPMICLINRTQRYVTIDIVFNLILIMCISFLQCVGLVN
jgi:hypothetical protein